MAIDTKTPIALYKANLELVMRLGALLQENRQRWTKFGMAGADNAVERTLSETGRMLTSNDWQSLATLPGETFWKALQGDAGPMQGAVDTAVSNQTAFAQGLQDAFAAWQQQCADVIQDAGAALPGNATFEGFLKTFTPQKSAAAARPTAAAPAAAKSKAKPKAKAKPAAAKASKSVAAKAKKASPARAKAKAGKAEPKSRK